MKKFFITSGLIVLVAAIGLIVASGQRPTTPATTQPATEPVTASATPDAPAPAITPAAQTATPAPAAATDAAPAAAPAAQPAPSAPAETRKISARVPEGMTPAVAGSVIGSLDPSVAPYRMTFSGSGAGITEIVFADFWKTFDDRHAAQKARENKDPAAMPPDSARFVLASSTAIGEFSVPVLAAREIEVDGAKANLFGAVWAEAAPGRFVTEIADADGRAIARVERAFVPSSDSRSYELLLAQRVMNLTAAPINVRLIHYGPGDLPPDPGSALDIRRFHFGYLYPEKRDPTQTFVHTNGQMIDRSKVSSQIANGDFDLWPNAASIKDEFTLSWFGSTDRYFAFAVHAPYAPPGSPSRKLTGIEKVQGISNGVASPNEKLITSLWTPVTAVAPQATASFDMGVYAGPLNPRVLKHTEPYLGLNMGGLVVYTMGGCCSWCTFAWLADALLWFLSFIHDYLVFDWGFAIIALVIVVRLILHPIQKRSQIAMQRFSRAMTAMKPELDALQKKFKDDPARMQQEQMRLFREKGVSPAGCLGGMLPMFAQMPIWMALYAVLFFAFDLRQQPAFFGFFQNFGGWSFLADLSAQDNFFRFSNPINLWLFSLSAINLLPVLMGIVFYFQQKYMSPPITPNMSEEQIQQQKIMKWMMVILFPIMTYVAPSGLTLYILTSTCIGIIESRIIKKQIDAMDLTAKPASGKKGILARVYEQALERAAAQQQQAGRGKPRGKDR
ncbi:MAG: Membrane protein insertase YidC [Planctomycetota bacterium]